MIYRHKRDNVVQEEDNVPRGLVLVVLMGTLVFSVILSAIGWGSTVARTSEIRPGGLAALQRLKKEHAVSEVVLDLYAEAGEGQALNAAGRRDLELLGWFDRSRGVARIPIQDAMDIVVAEQHR
jgi:hypothetical protein